MATVSNTATSPPVILSEPLDRLPVHLNTVLIQIGKLLKYQAIPEQRVLGVQKTQAYDTIIKTTRKFHDALDDIEIEFLSARAVLERDLNAIKAKQAERETAQLVATRNLTPEEIVAIEDIPIHDSLEDVVIKAQSPQLDQDTEVIADHPVEDLTTVPVDTETTETITQPTQDLNDIDLDNDLFGDELAGDFGPVDENSNFDIFNSTTGGDFDMDFSVEPVVSTTTASEVVPTQTAAAESGNAELSVDNDLLMQSFADISATGNTDVNTFADLDFDTIDQTQGDINGGDNPFGDHSNVEFDDFFNN